MTTIEITQADVLAARGIATRITAFCPWHRDDIESACLLELVKVARNWNPDKVGPGGWLAYRDTYMRGAARNQMRLLEGSGRIGGTAWAIKHPVSWDALVERQWAREDAL